MLAPKAINPPVWLLSLLACTIGAFYSYSYSYTRLGQAKPDETIEVKQEVIPVEAEVAEQPTDYHNLGQYLYQYFAANTSHQAYFCLLDGDHESFKYSRADVSYHLVALSSSDLTPYDSRPDSAFVAQLDDKQKVIIVEEINQTTEQHRYLIIDLAASSKILATVDTGTNQFCLEQSLHGSGAKYQLIGFDQLEGWGQQTVSPKVVFDLQGIQENKSRNILSWHKSKPRSKMALIGYSKTLKKQFADLDVFEGAPITYAPVDLAAKMAELIYEGNGAQAKSLLNSSWPANKKGKTEFAQAFYAEMHKGLLTKELSFH